MLGKGLESLIPPQKKNDLSAQGGGASNSPQNNSHGQGADTAGSIPQTRDPNNLPRILPEVTNTIPEKTAPLHKEEPELPQIIQKKESPPRGQSIYPERAGRAPGGMEAVFHIEVEKIKPNPHQPRRTFDDEGLRDLASSIREFGILQPIIVSKVEKETPHGVEVEYELVAGERRLMAAKLLGLPRVPAIVRRVDAEQEKLELAIIENLQRENLNPIEMARAFERLQEEFRLTQREIASRLGKSREVVANTVRLLDLPPRVQEAIAKGEITESHGRLLLGIPSLEAQQKLFEDLVSHHLSTRELRNRVNEKKEKKPHRISEVSDIEIQSIQEKLRQELGTPVTISQSGEKGKIMISFYSKEELEHILRKIGAGE